MTTDKYGFNVCEMNLSLEKYWFTFYFKKKADMHTLNVPNVS